MRRTHELFEEACKVRSKLGTKAVKQGNLNGAIQITITPLGKPFELQKSGQEDEPAYREVIECLRSLQ